MRDNQPGAGSVKQAFFFLGILFFCLVLFHGSVVWGGTLLCGGDLINNFMPSREGLMQHGWFAGWVPETFGGRPLSDDPQSGVMYLPNLLHLVVSPVELCLTMLTMLHLLGGGLGMFVLLRRLGFAPAVLGGILWTCGGFQILRLTSGILVFTQSFAWVPWMLWAAESQCLRRGTGLRAVGLLALFGGLQITAGAPQIVQVTWVGLGVWTLGRLWMPREGESRAAIAGGFVLAGIGSLLIAAPYIASSARFLMDAYPRGDEGKWEFLSDGSFQFRLLWIWMFPEYLGPTNSEELYWGSTVSIAETSVYIGMVPLVLGLFWLLSFPYRAASRKEWTDEVTQTDARWTASIVAVGFLGFLIAIGSNGFLFWLLVQYIPSFDLFRVPSRWLMWVFAAFIILAAYGLRHFEFMDREEKRPVVIRGISTIVIFLVLCGIAMVVLEPILDSMGLSIFVMRQQSAMVESVYHDLASVSYDSAQLGLMITVFLGAIGGLYLYEKLNRKVLYGLIFLVVVVDLLIFWQPFKATIPGDVPPETITSEAVYHRIGADSYRNYFFPETTIVRILHSDDVPGRVHYTDTVISYFFDQFHRELQQERPIVLGVPVTRGYQQIHLRSYIEDYRSSVVPYEGKPADAFLQDSGYTDRRFFDAYNVTHVVTHVGSGPLAYITDQLEAIGFTMSHENIHEAGLTLWENPAPRGWAWLSDEEAFLDADPNTELGRVTIDVSDANHWRGGVEADAPAWLHLSSPDYTGWSLIVRQDGGEPLETLNSRSVYLPEAGSYSVERVFRSGGLRAPWIALFLLGLLGSVAAIVIPSPHTVGE